MKISLIFHKIGKNIKVVLKRVNGLDMVYYYLKMKIYGKEFLLKDKLMVLEYMNRNCRIIELI